MKKSISFQCVSGGAAYSQVSVHITINHHTMHKHNTNQLSSPHSSQIANTTQIGSLSHEDIILNALDHFTQFAQAWPSLSLMAELTRAALECTS